MARVGQSLFRAPLLTGDVSRCAHTHDATSSNLVADRTRRAGTIASVSLCSLDVERQEEHAVTSSCRDPDRCGDPSVAGEPLHSHGGFHQVHPERSRSHSRGALAAEYLWTAANSDQHPHRQNIADPDVMPDELRNPGPRHMCAMTGYNQDPTWKRAQP